MLKKVQVVCGYIQTLDIYEYIYFLYIYLIEHEAYCIPSLIPVFEAPTTHLMNEDHVYGQ